ncbi:bacterial transcriptional activator domain-containing protein [Lentzea sp. NPDC051208]|uniref:AfsR/SARP family transcriptional regulator n=1 Tax=Lentzea sp. NPDC051208 TaxID=3154642 RepID=UPI003426B03F
MRRLIALLAPHKAPVPRTVAATLLWPEATARRAAACLRSSSWRLGKPAPVIMVVDDRQALLRALEALSERYLARGDHHHAHQAALAAVQTDPLRESAHRTLAELHLADGNPAQAVRQYQSYRTLPRAELGLEPSPGETVAPGRDPG